jgi:hypothetical protein
VKREFAPGFRLSVRDVVVIVAGAAGASVLWAIEPWWAFVVGFVVAQRINSGLRAWWEAHA